MTLNGEQTQSFEEASRPLVKWLNENCHPHVTVVVTPIGAELTEGIYMVKIKEFLQD